MNQPLSGLKFALSGLKPDLSGFESALSGLKSALSDSRPERADFRPERTDFKPERKILGLRGPGGGQQTDGRTNTGMKVPCILQDFVPFGTAALLPLNLNHILLKQGTGNTDGYYLRAAIIFSFGQRLLRARSPVEHGVFFSFTI